MSQDSSQGTPEGGVPKETHEIRIRKLEFWRDGNGAPGAEERLRAVQSAVDHLEGCSVTADDLKDLEHRFERTVSKFDKDLDSVAERAADAAKSKIQAKDVIMTVTFVLTAIGAVIAQFM